MSSFNPTSSVTQTDKQSRPTTLNFITGNANKLMEVRAILDGVVDLQSRDIPGLDEIQGTIEEIARDKCSRAAERVSVYA
jgi:inosine triphosphate pyrophosphatase